MPYTTEHKARTRARIVAAARRLFNRRGFNDVSIDEIMDAAGLTRGGFYNHFSGKDELFAEAVRHILTCSDRPARHMTRTEEVILGYLCDERLTNVDASCPLIAFPSDVARGSKEVQCAYREVLGGLIGLLQRTLDDDEDTRSRAVAIATLCVGGMMLARAVGDPGLGEEIRNVAREQALAIGGVQATQRKHRAA